VYRYYLRWAKKGLFKRLLHHTAKQFNQSCFKIIDGSHVKVHQDACYKCQNIENQYFGKTKGGRNTKIHAMTNGEGKPLDFRLMPGHQQEITNALELLGNLKNTIVLADKGYDSNELRLSVREMGGIALIPGRSNRKDRVFYIKEVGRRRYLVENYFSKVKRFRRIGTRYDRLPQTYESFLAIASTWLWLK